MFLFFVLRVLTINLRNTLQLKKGTEITCRFNAEKMNIKDENTSGKNVFFIHNFGYGGFEGIKFILNTKYVLKQGTTIISENNINESHKLEDEIEILLKNVEVVLKDQTLDIFQP